MNTAMPNAIIVDMDGTMALRHAGRSFYDASTSDLDHPNPPVVWLVQRLQVDHVILVCSGREDKDRAPTERWLKRHEIAAHSVFMRPTGDFRKDAIIKREIYEAHIKDNYNVRFVLDDRQQVVDAWRKMGLPCFQVAPGNF